MFLPHDEAHRKIMNIENNAKFNYGLKNNFYNSENFSEETLENIKILFKKIINNENKIEIWRCKLNRMQMFSVKNVFKKIIDNRMPEDKFAYITKMDLNYYFSQMQSVGMQNSGDLIEDVGVIVQIFDKDKDGKISFNEVNIFLLVVSS